MTVPAATPPPPNNNVCGYISISQSSRDARRTRCPAPAPAVHAHRHPSPRSLPVNASAVNCTPWSVLNTPGRPPRPEPLALPRHRGGPAVGGGRPIRRFAARLRLSHGAEPSPDTCAPPRSGSRPPAVSAAAPWPCRSQSAAPGRTKTTSTTPTSRAFRRIVRACTMGEASSIRDE